MNQSSRKVGLRSLFIWFQMAMGQTMGAKKNTSTGISRKNQPKPGFYRGVLFDPKPTGYSSSEPTAPGLFAAWLKPKRAALEGLIRGRTRRVGSLSASVTLSFSVWNCLEG